MKRFWTPSFLMIATVVICIVFMVAWQVDSRVSEGEYYVTTERGSKYENTAPPHRELININTATSGELQTIPQIGQKRAADIIAHREQYGSFQNIADIMTVSGISEGTFEIIRDYITIGEAEK